LAAVLHPQPLLPLLAVAFAMVLAVAAAVLVLDAVLLRAAAVAVLALLPAAPPAGSGFQTAR